MPDGARTHRVSEEFREILAEEIPKLKDPRVGFVTITRVEVTPDLRRATVFFTVMGDESAEKATRAGLRSAAPRLRQVIGAQVRLKVLPDLDFRVDAGIVGVKRVEELLERIHEEEDRDDR